MDTPICIVRKQDRAVIVRIDRDEDIQDLESNWYLAPALITEEFIVTERTYHCPYKGICNWVDLKTDSGIITNAAWVYPEPKAAYAHIAGWYGFYPDHRYYEIIECE